MKHARLSASSAHRWLVCAGSVEASKGRDTSSYEAAQGTVAHAIAASILEHGPDRGIQYGEIVLEEGHQIEVDQEMMDAVDFYVRTVLEDEQPGDVFWTEMPLTASLQKIDMDLGGTADRVRYRPSTKSLRVFDYKHGSGVYVDVDENEQELVYALGAMLELDLPIAEVILTIVQPRFEGALPVRDYKFSPAEIIDFIARVQQAAIVTRQKDAPLVAGDHCKFCPAARDCPELEKRQHALVAQDFSSLSTVAPSQLAIALDAIPLVKARIKAIEEHAYAEAQRGIAIPGYKLVDKIARRKWKDENAVKEWAKAHGLVCVEPKMLSPAQLEKLCVSKEAKSSMKDLYESKSSGTVLVPVADDRPPAQHALTADAFTALPAPEGSATSSTLGF